MLIPLCSALCTLHSLLPAPQPASTCPTPTLNHQAYLLNGPLGRSGFLAAFSLIFLSEIGDKTFFIAGGCTPETEG